MAASAGSENRHLPGTTQLERVTRIELALSAWEADVLPLNYTRAVAGLQRNYRSLLCPGQDIVPDRVGCVGAPL